jgi:hypothetical protein
LFWDKNQGEGEKGRDERKSWTMNLLLEQKIVRERKVKATSKSEKGSSGLRNASRA